MNEYFKFVFIGEFYLSLLYSMVYVEWIVKSPDYFGQIIVIFIECGYINVHMYTHVGRVFIIT